MAPRIANYDYIDFTDEFDTTYLEPGEFSRLVKDTAPDDVLSEFDTPDPELIGIGGRRELFIESPIEDLAECAYGESPFYDPGEARDLVQFLERIRYVVVVSMQNPSLPHITNEKQFLPGFLPGQAHVFELETAKRLGSFSFASTNTAQIQYTYDKNESAASKDGSAMDALEKDLRENGGLAFVHRLKQVAPGAVTGYEKEIGKMPYGESSLASALLGAVKQKRIEQSHFDKAIQGLEAAKQRTDPATPAAVSSPIQLDDETRTLVHSILKDEGKLSAIKEVRTFTGASLKASKEYVESLMEASDGK